MSETSKYAINATTVQITEQNHGTIIGTQNTYESNPELASTIADLKTLITELQTKHPNITTETEALEIIDAEFTEITQNPSHKFNKLGKQILNPERHFQAGKATIVEVLKKKLDQSLIATAIVTYLDKFSETPDKGA
jgi:hypothetical protein